MGFLYNHCRFDDGGVELQFENFPHEGLLLEVWCIIKTYAPCTRSNFGEDGMEVKLNQTNTIQHCRKQ